MIKALIAWFRRRALDQTADRLRMFYKREQELEGELTVVAEFFGDDMALAEQELDSLCREICSLRQRLRELTSRPSKLRPGCTEWQTVDLNGNLIWVDDASPQLFLNEKARHPGTATIRALSDRNSADALEKVREAAYS